MLKATTHFRVFDVSYPPATRNESSIFSLSLGNSVSNTCIKSSIFLVERNGTAKELIVLDEWTVTQIVAERLAERVLK